MLIDFGFMLMMNVMMMWLGGRVRVMVSTTATANATFAEYWIGVYLLVGVDLMKMVLVKYVVLGCVDGYVMMGLVSVVFETLTYRAATYDFVLFANALNVMIMMEVVRSVLVYVEDVLVLVWLWVMFLMGWGGLMIERGASVRVTW